VTTEKVAGVVFKSAAGQQGAVAKKEAEKKRINILGRLIQVRLGDR
jgi:hypothetical protein